MLYFIDFETRSEADLTAVGAHVYAYHPTTDVSVLGYADEHNQGRVWSPVWTGDTFVEPSELIEHVREGGLVVAWNAFFDRHIWNGVMVLKYGWPPLKREQVLCAQAQAEANNLPGGLAKAADCLGTTHKKDPQGARLIKLLCVGTRESWDADRFNTPEMLGHFQEYCRYDVLATREVWQHTRPLMDFEWDQYHASEEINDRGIAVDAEFAAAATEYAAAEAANVNEEMAELTGDPGITITAHLRKAKWLHDQLWPNEDIQRITQRPPKDGKPRYSCDRPTREAIFELLSNPDNCKGFEPEQLDTVMRFIELIEAGNSAAVYKFRAIANQAGTDGRVRGAYAFNGAGQTGRFSSRGIQIHNMIRTPLDENNADRAVDAVEDICAGTDSDTLTARYGLPVSRLLARLLRPTFIASPGHTLIWGDWAQIEARVLPWLSDTDGGDKTLDIFANGQDVYKYAAAGMFGVPMDKVNKEQRQMGKVATLALGFGGSVGAFAAMGRNYGVVLPEHQTQAIVTAWRDVNSWCVQFWHELWDAAMQAYFHPGETFSAGMVDYLYHPNLMRGTLICILPSGRCLVYPQFEHGKAVRTYPNGDEEIYTRTSFIKAFGGGSARVDLWYGILAENITQAVAADLLRDALTKVKHHAVLHTHDELMLEVPENQVADMSGKLRYAMLTLPKWADGLPVEADIEHGPFYTK